VGLVAVVLALATGCGSTGSSASPGPTTATTPTTAGSMDATVAADQIPGLAPARAPFGMFEQVQATIVSADGHTHTPCLLLARTSATRDQGLMNVTDAKLGGYPGMVFAFDGDVTGTFWMKDTLIPLSVVFLDQHGRRISSSDMVPCPASTTNCPLYPATAPYRWAIEVPAGQLAALGLSASDQPKVTIGGACGS
jgi:uncharacterized protein